MMTLPKFVITMERLRVGERSSGNIVRRLRGKPMGEHSSGIGMLRLGMVIHQSIKSSVSRMFMKMGSTTISA